jgi:hypothetical protein
MLRTPAVFTSLTLCLLTHAGMATAQQKPSEAPPKLEVIEQGSDTPITVTPPKSAGTKITEKKEGGRVTEVKVKSGNSSYTMKPNVPAGNAQPGDAQSSAFRAPQWTVLEFDLNKKKKTDRENVPEAADAPPPPVAAPAAK